jgi:hypothetical protein
MYHVDQHMFIAPAHEWLMHLEDATICQVLPTGIKRSLLWSIASDPNSVEKWQFPTKQDATCAWSIHSDSDKNRNSYNNVFVWSSEEVSSVKQHLEAHVLNSRVHKKRRLRKVAQPKIFSNWFLPPTSTDSTSSLPPKLMFWSQQVQMAWSTKEKKIQMIKT